MKIIRHLAISALLSLSLSPAGFAFVNPETGELYTAEEVRQRELGEVGTYARNYTEKWDTHWNFSGGDHESGGWASGITTVAYQANNKRESIGVGYSPKDNSWSIDIKTPETLNTAVHSIVTATFQVIGFGKPIELTGKIFSGVSVFFTDKSGPTANQKDKLDKLADAMLKADTIIVSYATDGYKVGRLSGDVSREQSKRVYTFHLDGAKEAMLKAKNETWRILGKWPEGLRERVKAGDHSRPKEAIDYTKKKAIGLTH